MNPLYPEVAHRAQHRCEYCHAPEPVFNFSFEVEHILPSSSGGTNTLDNLALACRSCNAFKGYRQSALDPETRQHVPLFPPREEVWEDHFEVDSEANTLLGKTPTGRATVLQLQVNSEEQIEARALWRQLNRFP